MAIVPTEQDRATSDGLMGRLAEVLGFGGQGAAQAQPAMAPVQVAQGPAYDNGLGAFAFGDAFQQSYNAGRNQQIAQAQAQAAQRQAQQLAQAKAAYIAQPNARTFAALTVLDPKNAENIERGFKALDVDEQKVSLQEVSAIRGYLAAGRPEDAAKRLEARIAADKAAGQDTTDDEAMLDMIRTSPKEAAAAVDYQLAAIMGPERWSAAFKEIGDNRRADETLPAEIGLKTAQAGQADAAAGKAAAETAEIPRDAEADRTLKYAQTDNYRSAIDERAGRLELDRDTLDFQVQAKLDELDAKRNAPAPLSSTAEKTMTDAVTSAETSRALSSRAGILADKIGQTPMAGGWIAGISEAGKGMFGAQNPATAIRKEYQSLITSDAIKRLPPGPASDKDIKLLMEGYPAPTARPGQVQEFLKAMSRTQARVADLEQGKADWISENGNIGRASRDMTINGRQVAKGSTYADYSNAATVTSSGGDTAAASILGRYGR